MISEKVHNQFKFSNCFCFSTISNTIVSVFVFVQLCAHFVFVFVFSLVTPCLLILLIIVRKAAGVYDSFAMLWRRYKSKNVTHFNEWHCHQLSCPRQMKRAIFLNTFHVWWKLCLLTITLNFKYHDKPAPVLQIAHWIHCWCRAQTGYTELINHHHCSHLFINQLKFNPSIVPKPNLLLCKRSI